MNSEELEKSLRTEFESYLKDVFSEIKQNVSELQGKFEAELEKHKSQVNQSFEDFSARFDDTKELDEIFKESIVEHLRLSKDEGARITATAFAEAEKLDEERAEAQAASAGIKEILEAVNDISSKDSQSAILKTLIEHAEQFTPRGAFFIIKKEHLVGWRTFGKESAEDDGTIREVFFPAASSTVLGESVRSLSAVKSNFGSYSDDSIYLNKLDFGQPENMYAIPLVVRGRSVAALYADSGSEGGEVNIEALETLVRVASLTVEVLAGSTPDTQKRYEVQKDESRDEFRDSDETQSDEIADSTEQDSAEQYEASETEYGSETESENYQPSESFQSEESLDETDHQTADDNYSAESYLNDSQPEEIQQDASSDDYSFEVQPPEETPFQPKEVQTSGYEMPQESEEQAYSWNQPEETSADETEDDSETYQFPESSPTYEIEDSGSLTDYSQTAEESYKEEETYQFEDNQAGDLDQNQFEQTAQSENSQFDSSQFDSSESAQFDSTQFEADEPAQFDSTQFQSTEVEDFPQVSGAESEQFDSFNQNFETQAPQVEETVATAPVRSRFSDRNVDLPIEVGEEERRLHNDARRFARLLVSEIKLYNEQKVKEGREANDLYERLREAIDRSREMYDKRVQPPVAARFDYFHYEVINTLAEGEEEKLGGSYPGAAV